MYKEINDKAVMKIIGVFVVLFFAMIEDMQYGKIRNVWVILVFLLDLLLTVGELGPKGFCLYPSKVLLWIIPLFLLYRTGGIGAGDAKLLAVLAASFGQESGMWFWGGFFLCAVVPAFIGLIRGRIKGRIPLGLPMWFGYMTFLINKGDVL